MLRRHDHHHDHHHHDHDHRERRGDVTRTRIGRHRGGRGRPFEREALRLVLLQMIAETPRSANQLMGAIADRRGGARALRPGIIEPTLTMLEDLGHVGVTTDADGAKRYEVTPKGTVVLDGNRATIDAIAAHRHAVRRHDVAPQILRPMAKLQQALRRRLAQPDLGAAGIRAMAAAIDAAAVTVAHA